MAQTTLRDYLQTTEDAINSSRVNEALVNCQHILTYFPDLLEAQRLLGEIYLKQGNLAEAQQTFDWILSNDPENVVAYCSRALISERLTDYDTALDCYQQAYELSRGNGYIRQEFNQLSKKVGQQDFIFSRAGLARLYMRGDLLPQAIQEWEAVLTVTPDRLDAQVGLLETLWREGFYDRVEQLATHILQEVPGCLKALLLLAHVTLPQNAQQAQEIMQRARALDPDLVMAQELFSDYLVSHPRDPFAALLKIPPTIFPDTSNGKHAEPMAASAGAITANTSNGTQAGSTFSDPLGRWSSLDNIIEPQQDYQPAQEASPFANWASSGTASSDFEAWNTLGLQSLQPAQPTQSTTPAPAQAAAPESDSEAFDSWSAFAQQVPQSTQSTSLQTSGQEGSTPTLDSGSTTNLHTDALEQHGTSPAPSQLQQDEQTSSDPAPSQEQTGSEQQQAWYHVDMLGEAPAESWGKANTLDTSDPAPASWEIKVQDNALPAPPAWLDMLTREERRQPGGRLSQQSTATPPAEPEPLTFITHPAAQQNTEPPAADQASAIDKTAPQQPDEESSFFGPEWLKSLGAAALDSPSAIAAESPAVEDVLSPPPLPAPAARQQTEFSPSVESEPSTAPAQTHVSHLTQGEPAAAPEPAPVLEPVPELATPAPSTAPASIPKSPVANWLDQAAQKLAQPEQSLLTTLEELEYDLRSKGFTPMEPGALSSLAQEPSLSSALAEFGNYEQQPVSELEPASTPLETLANFVATPAQKPANESVPEVAHVDAASQLAPHSAASTSFSVPATPTLPPVTQPTLAAHPTFPLDAELETTMKRPPIRLQPMQQRPSGQPIQPPARGRSAERPAAGKAAEGNISYKERLLKGYQYQLAGSYDDAMQEYRVIIRNAPDLLGEVVSNMRALLKLAPKYSAGYRVLGDAYMRQGEYLQAMEAYNKALTMAKKAKG